MLETVVPKVPNAAVMLVGRKRKGQVKKSGVLIINQNLICKFNNFMQCTVDLACYANIPVQWDNYTIIMSKSI